MQIRGSVSDAICAQVARTSLQIETGYPLNFTPLEDRVLVRRIASDERPTGWFFITEAERETLVKGEIIRVGSGARNDAGERIEMEVKVGDTILFSKRNCAEVKLEGEDLLVMKVSDILGLMA